MDESAEAVEKQAEPEIPAIVEKPAEMETPAPVEKPDYGIDAPAVLRNFFLAGAACVIGGFLFPHELHLGPVTFKLYAALFWTGGFLLAEGLLYLLYVKKGKLKHRDYMLSLHEWKGDEQVLDVGCGRGLLMIGAAKRLTPGGTGKAIGIDVWSNVDMGSNSPEATQLNMEIEGVEGRCKVMNCTAQSMVFAKNSFDVVVSNLCLHNIYNKAEREEALGEIVRVLRPGGVALISDYKLTREYAKRLKAMGLTVERKMGNVLATFPPLAVVVARKPTALP
jgi:SAM-dependent methyltransferase